MQTDAELGDMMMRAFILRRVELVAAGMRDVVLIDSMHSFGYLRLRRWVAKCIIILPTYYARFSIKI
jgi:thioredoxin reductase (NADPH)